MEPEITTAPAAPLTLADILDPLCRPFSVKLIEVKPGATTKDKKRALALAYVDMRAYMARLDRLAGVEGWRMHYVPWGDRRLICRLTILGVTKESTGEGEPNDPNAGTSAEAQAFKRACAAFGFGRYLYALPSIWCDYDEQTKSIIDPAGVARRIYQVAGLPI
jgi:hypothetical protein